MTGGPAKPALSPFAIVLAAALALLLVVGVGTWWLWPTEWGIGGRSRSCSMSSAPAYWR